MLSKINNYIYVYIFIYFTRVGHLIEVGVPRGPEIENCNIEHFTQYNIYYIKILLQQEKIKTNAIQIYDTAIHKLTDETD